MRTSNFVMRGIPTCACLALSVLGAEPFGFKCVSCRVPQAHDGGMRTIGWLVASAVRLDKEGGQLERTG